VKLCAKKEVRSKEKVKRKRSYLKRKRSDLKRKRSDLKKKRSDLQEKGKICKLCALIKVRIVKSLRSGSFVLCRSKISEIFVSKAWI
jgi:hypothetical protein